MSVSNHLSQFLEEQGVVYQTLNHAHSQSSVDSANFANIPPHQLAKAVVLEDHQGKKLVAVLPTDYKINFRKLNKRYNARFKLAKEETVYSLFNDCEIGAIPPLGEAFHLHAIYDESLLEQPDIYLEAGDHKTLVHLSGEAFAKLLHNSEHARFSRAAYF
jgi:Ala-tRNA(Pro) deacylase